MTRDLYAEASDILSKLAVGTVDCDHGDRQLFCRTDLEAEVASLLRKVEIAKAE